MADQVLVTGITGFIAKWVALELLHRGYRVRGTLRSAGDGGPLAQALAKAGAATDGLSFHEADLLQDAGWADAVQGCRYVCHVASPFPKRDPADREALVPAAREGALRVIDAALTAGAERIVMTASIVTMMYSPGRPSVFRFGENDWSDPDWRALSAYPVSKIRAERAAWERMSEADARQRLAVVNPGFVLGPLLDERPGTSVAVVQMLLKGSYPAVPRFALPVVDVRDLAALHVDAMESQAAGGRRWIGAADTLSLLEMCEVLRDAMPDRAARVPRIEIPDFLARSIAPFDRSLRAVQAALGTRAVARAGYVTQTLGTTFRPAREAVIASAESLLNRGLA